MPLFFFQLTTVDKWFPLCLLVSFFTCFFTDNPSFPALHVVFGLSLERFVELLGSDLWVHSMRSRWTDVFSKWGITNPAEVWEADPRHIAEDDPADAAVAATRCERAALHAVQEQVRRAAWAVAGLRYAHAAAWHVKAVTKAKPPGAGGGAAGDGFEVGWAGLARLVQARAALVAAA